MKNHLLIAMLLMMSLPVCAQQFVDLGLPSGTLWKNHKEAGSYIYDDALRSYGGFIPSSGQFKELIDCCTWKWMGDGYVVTGRNGNTIFLATETSSKGAYWSSTKDSEDGLFGLLIFHIPEYPDYYAKVDRTRSFDRPRFVILCK